MTSLSSGSTFLLPLIYGVGTALPVLGFAMLIALGSRKLGVAFNAVSKVEHWARLGTGGLILTVGCILTIQSLL